MAPSALRVAAITSPAAPTPSQMCGVAAQVVGATMAISTETDMYLRKISTRGVILTRAVTRLVTVTATGSAPEPPLVASGSGLAVVGVVVAVAVIALIAVAIASALALREPLPPRPAGAGS